METAGRGTLASVAAMGDTSVVLPKESGPMIFAASLLGRVAGATVLALGLSACAADGPPAVAPPAAQTSLGANPAPGGVVGMSQGGMAGMDHGGMAGMSQGGMAGMDHGNMTSPQMRTMMAQCSSVRADAQRGVALSPDRQAILQHCNMMQPAGAAPATGAPAVHRH